MGGVEIEDLEAGDEVVGAAGRDHHLRSRNIFVSTLTLCLRQAVPLTHFCVKSAAPL